MTRFLLHTLKKAALPAIALLAVVTGGTVALAMEGGGTDPADDTAVEEVDACPDAEADGQDAGDHDDGEDGDRIHSPPPTSMDSCPG